MRCFLRDLVAQGCSAETLRGYAYALFCWWQSPFHRSLAGPGSGGQCRGMLENSDVAARLPCRDLARARAFYADKLGLQPVEERPGGLR